MLRVNHLCGFGAKRRGSSLTSITQVASATSTSNTITAPANIIAGDLLVLADSATSVFATPTSVVPTGFTQAANNFFSNGTLALRDMLTYKLATGSEASSSITGMDGNSADDKVLLVFRGNVPATSLTLASANGQGTDVDPSAQNVTASTGVAPLVVLAAYGSTGAVSPRTMSPAKDGEVNIDTFFYAAWKIYNSAPADVSVDMDDEGACNVLQSCYIQMAG